MGLGHLVAAFEAKPAVTKISLWVRLVACEGLDLLCFGYVAIGVEKFGVFH